ncbi:MAG: hypothetical protein U0176_19095 [Bacteroidia bacterium]
MPRNAFIPSPLNSVATRIGSRWWVMVMVIFVGRILWWLYWGTLLEIDSVGYLHLQTTLYHPPLYNAFCWIAIQIGQVVDAVVIAQSVFFAISAAFFLRKVISKDQIRDGWHWRWRLSPVPGNWQAR